MLGHLEEQVLTIVLKLQKVNEKAFGLLIFDKLIGIGINVVNGTVYNTLSRLESKGLLRSETTKPISQRGGRGKRIYFLEDKGIQELKECYMQKKAQMSKLSVTFEKT